MLISLVVNAAPEEGQSAWSAYQFALAALARGHSLYRIFFYHSGVVNASTSHRPPQDEIDLTALWQELAASHRLDLVVCISAAKRRGVFNVTEAKRHHTVANLAEGFELSGLGQYTDALVHSDRVISFGV